MFSCLINTDNIDTTQHGTIGEELPAIVGWKEGRGCGLQNGSLAGRLKIGAN
jgi:hypothetical protein